MFRTCADDGAVYGNSEGATPMSCKKSFKHAVPAKCGRRRGHRDESSSSDGSRRRRHHRKHDESSSGGCRPKPKRCR
jgi:hypothetical protein